MFDFIRKAEFFEWWDRGLADKNDWTLKGIQDAWIRSMLVGATGLRIAEVGGGVPRVLPVLAERNECWNIDKLEGAGNGPTMEDGAPEQNNVTRIDADVGAFDPRLEDNAFDVVFSISVLEHIPDDAFEGCFRDMARILKPGGRMLHAIDLYTPDGPERIERVELYRHAARRSWTDLRWLEPPAIPELVRFRAAYASNADHQLASWNRVVPIKRPERETTMNCSIKAVWVKPSGSSWRSSRAGDAG